MKSVNMNLFNKDRIATIYAMLEKAFEILMNFLINFIVIRMLKVEDYAIITVFAGYASIIGVINITPESQLYKIFHTLNKEQLSSKLVSYSSFALYKGFIIELIYVVLGIWLSVKTSNVNYLLYAFFVGILSIEEIFWQLFRISLELQYHQERLMRLTIFAKICKLILFILFYFMHSLLIYSLINIFVVLMELIYGFGVYYGKNSIKKLCLFKKVKIKEIVAAISEFAVLNHISGVLNSIIYYSDTVFLQLFVNETIIGHYGVTLGCINYINIVFQVIQKQVSIALGNNGDLLENKRIVVKFLRITLCGSMAIFAMYLLWGKIVLRFYAGESYIEEMYVWGIFILAGTCIFNGVRPMFSMVIYKGDLRVYLLKVLIPIFILMLITYYTSSRNNGALGMAMANTIVYAIWSISIIISYKKLFEK